MPEFKIKKVKVEVSTGQFVLTKGRIYGSAKVDEVVSYCVWNCHLFIRDMLGIPSESTIGDFVAQKYEYKTGYDSLVAAPSRL